MHGVDYIFVSKGEFESWIDEGQLLEHATVYGDYKGIPKQQVTTALQRGTDVVLRIDVQGAATVRKLMPAAVTIFLVSLVVDWLPDWAEPAAACLVAKLAAGCLPKGECALAVPLLAVNQFFEQPSSHCIAQKYLCSTISVHWPGGSGVWPSSELGQFDACISQPLRSVATAFVLVCRWLSQSMSLGTAWLPGKLRVR